MKKLITICAVVGVIVAMTASAGAAYTVAGYSWEQEWSVSDGSVIAGPLVTFGAGWNPGVGFDPLRTTPHVIGEGYGAGGLSSELGHPDGSVGDRDTIEVSWGANWLVNSAGKDFVVYENGSLDAPEGVMVAVKRQGDEVFSDWRYHFSDAYDSVNAMAFATGFDLDDFGIGEAEAIVAIRIQNLLPADTVDDVSGQGAVIIGGGSGFTPVTGPLGPGGAYSNSKFDPDITFVVGLTEPVPEPMTMSLLALGGLGALIRRRHRK